MPELPEVETVVRDLRPMLVGRSFVKIAVGRKSLRRKWSRGWSALLVGQRVHSIGRRGKWILLELGEPRLLVHLGMTGQFTVVPADLTRETHTHIVFTLDDGNELRFRDVRRFGSVTFFPSQMLVEQHFDDIRLGPEPFDLDVQAFRAVLSEVKRNLKGGAARSNGCRRRRQYLRRRIAFRGQAPSDAARPSGLGSTG